MSLQGASGGADDTSSKQSPPDCTVERFSAVQAFSLCFGEEISPMQALSNDVRELVPLGKQLVDVRYWPVHCTSFGSGVCMVGWNGTASFAVWSFVVSCFSSV